MARPAAEKSFGGLTDVRDEPPVLGQILAAFSPGTVSSPRAGSRSASSALVRGISSGQTGLSAGQAVGEALRDSEARDDPGDETADPLDELHVAARQGEDEDGGDSDERHDELLGEQCL